jgi:radical SAM superfamily enzyme YgiQ (UPF0313 family)
MRIKLISPRMSLRPMDSEYKRRMAPSLGLLVLGALTPREHEVIIEDENAGRVRYDDQADLVGITVNVDTSARAYAIAERFRARGVPVILGGIHVSANPEEALEHADAVCIGEAEGVWLEVLDDAQAGRLKPRYRSVGVPNAGQIPAPRWDLLDRSRYLYTNIVCATRGCCFRCEFCYNSCDYVHQGSRPRPVEHVVDEIARLKTKHAMFIDDNLIGNVPWAREFVKALTPLDLTWHGAVSANVLDHPDLLDEMAHSGCRSLFIGFESVNAGSVRGAGKKQNRTESYERLIAEIHRRGIMVNASLAFGFDQDGPDVFDRTLDWLVRNKVETMTAHILTPYPGTRLFDRLLREGRIDDFDWRHYNTANVVFQPKQMSKAQLLEGYLRVYREFYSFRNILRRTPDDPYNVTPYLLFNFGYRKFGKLTSLVARLGLMGGVGRLARRMAYGI